uniref:Uncharacterized protein n=1 Tax=Glossina morsitans morsitans TaxID=37546 RepID=A0A1B0G7H6_GLOMM
MPTNNNVNNIGEVNLMSLCYFGGLNQLITFQFNRVLHMGAPYVITSIANFKGSSSLSTSKNVHRSSSVTIQQTYPSY